MDAYIQEIKKRITELSFTGNKTEQEKNELVMLLQIIEVHLNEMPQAD